MTDRDTTTRTRARAPGVGGVFHRMAVHDRVLRPDSERTTVATTKCTKGGCKLDGGRRMPGAGLSRRSPRKAPLGQSAFQPYWGKLAVRNDRGDRGNVGIIRSPIRASILPDLLGHGRTGQFWFFCSTSDQEKHLLPYRNAQSQRVALPGLLAALHSSLPHSIYIAESLIRINAGSFGGEIMIYRPNWAHVRNWTKPALRGCGGRYEFARHQGKWTSVKAPLGRSDRARCGFFRDRRAQPRRECQRGMARHRRGVHLLHRLPLLRAFHRRKGTARRPETA